MDLAAALPSNCPPRSETDLSHNKTMMIMLSNNADFINKNDEEIARIDNNQDLVANIKMLAAMLGDNENKEQQQQPDQDEISCLTDSSFPLSEIYELAENDIIFHAANTASGSSSIDTTDKSFSNHHGQHEQRFQQLLEDYADLYRSSRSEEEKSIVVTEVVRIWRSQEPAGRFLIRTEPKRGEESPYHDIGDESARERTVRLLLLADDDRSSLPERGTTTTTTRNHNRKRQPRKDQDDRTASTCASSSLSKPSHTTSSHSSGSGNSNSSSNRHYNHDGECFGGSFRAIVMSFFNMQSDGVMNQFLP